jgi:hypothetical protein
MAFDKTSFEGFGRKLNNEIGEATQKLEQEGEKVIAYLNDEVVPAIRNNSSKALRVAAEKLSQLANYMENKASK